MSQKPIYYAAIDLGTNALRAVIARKCPQGIRIVKNYRHPLRLGIEVFNQGLISPEKMQETIFCFKKLKQIVKKHDVSRLRAVGTSALRNAQNAHELIEEIWLQSGILLEKIDGLAEAKLIQSAASSQYILDDKLVLYLDIGGGSIEFSLSTAEELIFCKSYPLGTIRMLSLGERKKMKEGLKIGISQAMAEVKQAIGNKKIDVFIGTGGNLRRMGKLRVKMLKKNGSNYIKRRELAQICLRIEKMTLKQRMQQLDMRKDRADVIEPAMIAVLYTMKALKLENINLPKVGLKEGLLLTLLDESNNP